MALPFPDGHADRAAAIHVFEHFYLWQTPALLAEWKRVLKPGGKLVLELPCMDYVIGHIAMRMAKGEKPQAYMSWLPLWGDPRYKSPAMAHKWGYFKGDIVQALTNAGFKDVRLEEARYHFPHRDMRVSAIKPETNNG